MKKLLVPIDFQNTTFNALNYGLHFGKNFGYEVHALHLIDSESQKKNAIQKMDELISSFSKEEQAIIKPIISTGKIESHIGSTAEAIEASFILMGIHKKVD